MHRHQWMKREGKQVNIIKHLGNIDIVTKFRGESDLTIDFLSPQTGYDYPHSYPQKLWMTYWEPWADTAG
ncbi:hypothetical protein [Sansalvadorimonas verongulae]|uniref:hypothetical protein n=1 Tax=Sansalvadorimonas verongulae TaxID=2172824 RepID=UPI0012BBFA95|nr:hypothetical protein [Sansalvadorimonas verongulae]MTI11904.1 hypothetical protein [Sansalvadorimonas verongulae]